MTRILWQMGGITVENLDKKSQLSGNYEFLDIIDTQIDEIIVAHYDCIKRMEKEIKAIAVNKVNAKV